MNRSITTFALTCLLVWAPSQVLAQGELEYRTSGAPTRVGALDGPVAGTNIWGVLLGGSAPDSLSPLGVPVPHVDGYLEPNVPLQEQWPVPLQRFLIVQVPGVPEEGFAYLQLVAWDGAWGISQDQVPEAYQARSEIINQQLFNFPWPSPARFEQSLVVQLIPEPSGSSLALLGGMMVAAVAWRRRKPTLAP